MSRVAQRTGRRDRGGVATIVAVLLAGGVLIGMTALVVDVGRFYMEREELQSGADAAAYEVALDCIKNRPACATTAVDATADGYANKNAKDSHAGIIDVCGSAPDLVTGAPRLPACTPPPANNLTDCIGTVPAGVKYVEVRTRTEIPGGSTVLPASFAGALVPGYQGTTVAACARVGWGPPVGGLAFTFSQCEWDQFVPKDAAGNYLLAPLGTTDPSFEHAIILHDPDDSTTPKCRSGPSGFDLPGGFGWVDEDGGPCQAAIDSQDEYSADTGVPPSQACKDALIAAYNTGKPQLVPVYEKYDGTGENGAYTWAFTVAFVITGYRLPGLEQQAKLHGEHLCTEPQFCIYGYFTEYIESGGAIGTGQEMGATVIKTIG